jgi:hypothetical protein
MAGIIENGVIIARFVAPMTIISNQPVFVSDSISLKRQTRTQKTQRWEISTSIEPSNNSADLLMNAVLSNYSSIVAIQMPQIFRIYGGGTTSTSAIQVDGNINAGFSFLNIKNNNGFLPKGEFIQFSNHDKIYILKKSIQGNGQIEFFPELKVPLINNTFIKYGKNVILKARYDTDSLTGITYTDGVLADIGTVNFVEAI